MQAVMRWLWMVVLFLGLICLLFGVVFYMQGRTLDNEGLEAYSRSEGIETWDDVKEKMDMFKSQKEGKEDEFEGYGVAPDYKIREGEKVQAETVLGLYGSTPQNLSELNELDELLDDYKALKVKEEAGTLTAAESADLTILEETSIGVGFGYMELVDGMSGMGLGMMIMGMSNSLMFSGILNVVIGIAFVLISIVMFRIGRRMTRTDEALSELRCDCTGREKIEEA